MHKDIQMSFTGDDKVVAKSIASCTICWYNLFRWRKTPHPLAIQVVDAICVKRPGMNSLRFFRYPECVRLLLVLEYMD